ncbi:hypothetical protein [Photobacterium sp. 1_MG-2023]|uniref:hypothetical protein n=1 Tax=Photobacterium sp. 1_MG-2023 TaxID=3062646 RepID=UPI0026E22F1C|nr:hypothetical protein [Photobacterium sp. 1_MG-2023]MDO6707926.1 hypothetical protein [Photobacterium sp. 1_MG-2023]
MSQKTALQAHIDGLCEQLGISDKPYKDDTTIKELEKLIDELETQIPDDTDGDGTDGEGTDDTDLTEITMVDESALPPGAVIRDDLDGPEVVANANGDLLIKADVSIQLLSRGERVFIPAGDTAYVEESVALDAVAEKVAVLLAK